MASLVEDVVIHFAGDSGDGVQLIGSQFSLNTAIMGNDLRTFPDYPAEIRAPQGTIAGVSGFQVSFANKKVFTHGDACDVLVAMNPAALKSKLTKLKVGGILIVDNDKFTPKDLAKAGFVDDPLLEGTKSSELLNNFKIIKVPLTSLTIEAIETAPYFQENKISRAKARKCKNLFALGVISWLYSRDLNTTKNWLSAKFKTNQDILEANLIALKSGYNFAQNTEVFNEQYAVPKADLPKGLYRQITGNQAIALGVLACANLAKSQAFVCGYPITPASDILHLLAGKLANNVITFQAEDEISAIGAAIGAAYAGKLALTSTSGPGMDLKSEMLGLATMSELPLVIIDVQRAGPSTGMPTKVEQADLLMAMYGRHGECPIPILAPNSPKDCFYMTILAFQIAIKYMTPVLLLSDAAIANGQESWLIPKVNTLPDLAKLIKETQSCENNETAYSRNAKTLARKWVTPGIINKMYTLGGLEKDLHSGDISYTPENHQAMCNLRAQKINNIVNDSMIPKLEIIGDNQGSLLVITWGSCYGPCLAAVTKLQESGKKISLLNIKLLNPLNPELKNIMGKFTNIVAVELNFGHLAKLLRQEFLVDVKSINQLTGQPFDTSDLIANFEQQLQSKNDFDLKSGVNHA